MPLGCSCDYEYDPEPGQWQFDFWTGKETDFQIFKKWISKRCVSCNEMISFGDICVEFPRARYPYNEIESRIAGVDWDCMEEATIKISPVYQCEKCGEIYLNLNSVGFECISPCEDMAQLLRDYQIEYAPPKLKRTEWKTENDL